jgi:hypothetical protein
MRKTIVALIIALLLPTIAAADTLGSDENQRGFVTAIDKGVFQLGVDALMTSSYQKDEGADSVFRANGLARLTLRYLVARNVGVGIHAGLLVRKTGSAYRDLAFAGDLALRWYGRLGSGAFFAPELALGMLIGDRDITVGETELHNSLIGFTAGVKVPVAFFVGKRFSVEAGPELLFSTGSVKPKDGDSSSTTALDIGFFVGALYSF